PDAHHLVEADIVDHEGIAFDHLEIGVVGKGRGVVGFYIGELDFTGPQGRDGGGGVFEIAVDEAIDLGPAEAVILVGGDFHILVRHVAAEGEGAGADRLGGPPIAVGYIGDVLVTQRVLGQDHDLSQNREQRAVGL